MGNNNTSAIHWLFKVTGSTVANKMGVEGFHPTPLLFTSVFHAFSLFVVIVVISPRLRGRVFDHGVGWTCVRIIISSWVYAVLSALLFRHIFFTQIHTCNT